MKRITEHLVAGEENGPHLVVAAVGQLSNGGAHHFYQIRGKNSADAAATSAVASIEFQCGAVKEVGINGVQSTALIAIMLDQLRDFQTGPFACEDNVDAIEHLKAALTALQRRTRDRIARGVEGQARP